MKKNRKIRILDLWVKVIQGTFCVIAYARMRLPLSE